MAGLFFWREAPWHRTLRRRRLGKRSYLPTTQMVEMSERNADSESAEPLSARSQLAQAVRSRSSSPGAKRRAHRT